MSIIDKIRWHHLACLLGAFILVNFGMYLNSMYGSFNPASLWDMLKSKEYRQTYMETKLECMGVMASTGLRENVIDAVCIDMARIKAKEVYCDGKEVPICKEVNNEDLSSR